MFAGCGGVDCGLHQAGFKTVWANDFDKNACETYRANIGEIVCGDVRRIQPPDLADVDLLTAGFPCQPFSNAGKRLGTGDDRGSLFHSALEYIGRLCPKIVLFENVRGLATIRSGDELVLSVIIRKLVTLGYATTTKLLDASAYGVPQRRLRLFICGIRKDISFDGDPFPDPARDAPITLGHALRGLCDDTPNQQEIMPHGKNILKLVEHVPPGKSWKAIPTRYLPERWKKIRNNMAKYRSPNFCRRFAEDEVAGTVTATFTPENMGIWHPKEDRPLSVREVARIQSFPDSFVFHGESVRGKYQQIGNAVPPKLAHEFGKKLRRVLETKTGQEFSKASVPQVARPPVITLDRFCAQRMVLKPDQTPIVHGHVP